MAYAADIKGRKHYFFNYDHRAKWMLYWEQIETILSLKPKVKSVLIAGPGCGVVDFYLKQNGVEVDTIDVDKELNPTYMVDVREISKVVKKKYDVVVVAHILEHIPFEDLPKAFRELRKVTKRYVLFANPHISLFAEGFFHIHGWRPKVSLRLPLSFLKHKYDGTHHWEIGKRGFSERKVQRIIADAGFRIEREWRPPVNAWSHYFLLAPSRTAR